MNHSANVTTATLIGYLVGSIPFAYVLVRALKGIDIRTVGSGNVGATNAARVLGARYFLVVFGLDLAKGLIPTLIARRLGAQWQAPELTILVALATVIGHNFPIYLGFRGGKGVATSLGAAIAIDPAAAAAAAATFTILLILTRYVSLSSLAGGLAFACVHFLLVAGRWWEPEERALSCLILVLVGMLFVRHRANLARIVGGTEPKIRLRRRGDRDARSPSGGEPANSGDKEDA